MKYILIAVIVFGVSYIGYGINKYYRKRKRYFDDLILLTERLSVDISFSKDSLTTIFLNSLDSYGSDVKSIVNSYLEFLNDNQKELNNDLLFNKSTLIKKEEQETIYLFFKSLGRLDASNQIAEINNFKTKFATLKEDADRDNKKFGSLSFKLAILFALLVIILLI